MAGGRRGSGCTFLSLPRLTRVLSASRAGAKVTVIISVSYLDHAAHQAITDWQRQYEATGGTVEIRINEDLIEPEQPEPGSAKIHRRSARLSVVDAIPGASQRDR